MDGSVHNFLSEVNDTVPSEERIKETSWQECFDDQSGCPYYWNINTNAVTWEMPLEFKEWLEANKKPNGLFPSIASNVKVYNIREETSKLNNKLYTIKDNAKFNKTKVKKKPMPKSKNGSDSEDEKITLISSYGGDSDSESESADENKKKENIKPVQSEVTVLVPNTTKEILKDKVTGFSLLADYGDDDDTDLDEEPNEPEPTQSHSTLFPVIKPIDVKQFEEPKVNEYLAKDTDDLDTKAFKRKRRIGINLTNSPKHRALDADDDGGERKGFGFSENESAKSSSAKSGMKIAFIKSDTLNPTISEEKTEDDEISESHLSLKEKLLFLSEGKESVSPVQIMLIQLETLHTALRDGSLNSGYLKKWLTETCEGLVKLEEAAAPSGWLLQWDRAQKRYYYRNKVTDECQWDYPEMEDDAMDICTTPPPPADEEVCSTPVRTPSPSGSNSNVDPPAVESVVEEKSVIVSEPLPPGIDPQESEAKKPDLTSVLDSFYTDIAEIENTINKKVQEVPDPIVPKVVEVVQEPPAKKKKKVKVGSLQKKNVSKLVEKWNNVQKDLN
ncbi:PREDICTED: formin-binding protein 4-like [Nicrophorus vespilloides]|uniref:Formin-binding protein 4-like n=1 Tax=Nicrophorus vespilloides TaxID=110193 RepID=A0ABM1MR03_NICVS|nr:PREDICTED: formin-binding protein 4-like [Nicrophorus vespilloides]